MIIIGPSHAGKFLLLYPFQVNRKLGISEDYLWPATIAQKFYKDAFNLDLVSPNQTQGDIPELDNNVLMHLDLDPFITQYFKNTNPDHYYYLVLVNNQFMTTIPNQLNSNFHIYLPTIRDPRILWIVDRSTNDKYDQQFNTYFYQGINDFTLAYKKYIVDKPMVSLIQFEKLIADYSGTIEKSMLRWVGDKRISQAPLKRPSEQVNHFFTTDDRDNNKWFGCGTQEDLDIISEKCKDYIKLFGYKPKLTIEEIYDGTGVK
jgi:hypothetical protein